MFLLNSCERTNGGPARIHATYLVRLSTVNNLTVLMSILKSALFAVRRESLTFRSGCTAGSGSATAWGEREQQTFCSICDTSPHGAEPSIVSSADGLHLIFRCCNQSSPVPARFYFSQQGLGMQRALPQDPRMTTFECNRKQTIPTRLEWSD